MFIVRIIDRLRHRWRTLRCEGCGQRVEAVFGHHGDWRCNPCVVRRVRIDFILAKLQRDGILTIIKEY